MANASRSTTSPRSVSSSRKSASAATVRKYLELRARRRSEFIAAAKGAGLDDVAIARLLAQLLASAGKVRAGRITPAQGIAAADSIALAAIGGAL